MQNRVIDKKDKVVEIASTTFFLPKIKKYIMINYGFDEAAGGFSVRAKQRERILEIRFT